MRVAIFQPLIPAYRLPLYERLGSLPGIELTVYAGNSRENLRSFHQGSSFAVSSAPVHYGTYKLCVQFAQVITPIRHSVDLLILPWDVHYLTVIPALALARSAGISSVLWGHGYSLNPHPVTDTVRNFCGKLANAIMLYSGSAASRLVEESGFSRERVFVAQNALDQTPIQNARLQWLENPRQLADFQRLHQLDPAQTMLFVSRLEGANRVDWLLRATHALTRDYPNLKTVIIGGGSQRAWLEQLARAIGVADRVIFTGAIYEESNLAPWMLSAALFCYPTNVGLSLLHAFGYGLPVVTSGDRGAQNPEIEALLHGENGLEYKGGDLNDMVERCAHILRDADLRRRLSASALQTALGRYSMDRMVEGFTQIFNWAGHHRGAMRCRYRF